MGRSINVEVRLDEVRGDINRLIKKFIKKVKKERIIEKYLNKRVHEKPSVKRRRQKKRGIANAKKVELQRNKEIKIK